MNPGDRAGTKAVCCPGRGPQPFTPPCSSPGPSISPGLQPWAAVCGLWFLSAREGDLRGCRCTYHSPRWPVPPGHLQPTPRQPSAARYPLCLWVSRLQVGSHLSLSAPSPQFETCCGGRALQDSTPPRAKDNKTDARHPCRWRSHPVYCPHSTEEELGPEGRGSLSSTHK